MMMKSAKKSMRISLVMKAMKRLPAWKLMQRLPRLLEWNFLRNAKRKRERKRRFG